MMMIVMMMMMMIVIMMMMIMMLVVVGLVMMDRLTMDASSVMYDLYSRVRSAISFGSLSTRKV